MLMYLPETGLSSVTSSDRLFIVRSHVRRALKLCRSASGPPLNHYITSRLMQHRQFHPIQGTDVRCWMTHPVRCHPVLLSRLISPSRPAPASVTLNSSLPPLPALSPPFRLACWRVPSSPGQSTERISGASGRQDTQSGELITRVTRLQFWYSR